VTLPLLAPAILSGAMLAFASSLDDFIISMLLADAGQTTLPVYIYGMLRLGVTPEVNVVSTLLLVGSVSIVTFALVATQWSSAKKPILS
jgi:spermidine/putrescine transport system permease protein